MISLELKGYILHGRLTHASELAGADGGLNVGLVHGRVWPLEGCGVRYVHVDTCSFPWHSFLALWTCPRVGEHCSGSLGQWVPVGDLVGFRKLKQRNGQLLLCCASG